MSPQSYFKSPFVQGIMERNKTVVTLKVRKPFVTRLPLSKIYQGRILYNRIRQVFRVTVLT